MKLKLDLQVIVTDLHDKKFLGKKFRKLFNFSNLQSPKPLILPKIDGAQQNSNLILSHGD